MRAVLQLASCLLLISMTVASWGLQSSYDPGAPKRDKPRDSFADFALKQITAENTDFGCEVQAARKLAVDETIKSINFWTTLVALGLLVLSFVLLIHQHRESNRRELIAADFLAQYHNAWVLARRHADDAIRRCNDLVHIRDSADAADCPKSGEPSKSLTSAPPVAPSAKRMANSMSRSNRAAQNESSENAQSVLSSEADLIAQISALQQQLHAAHERERRLQKELSKVHPRVQPALRTDASLPG